MTRKSTDGSAWRRVATTQRSGTWLALPCRDGWRQRDLDRSSRRLQLETPGHNRGSGPGDLVS